MIEQALIISAIISAIAALVAAITYVIKKRCRHVLCESDCDKPT